MNKTKIIKIGDLKYNLSIITGIVADAKRQMETKITTQHGHNTNYINNGTTISTINVPWSRIKSENVVHDQIFMVDDDNSEHSFHLYNWSLDCRPGNRLSVAQIQDKKGNKVELMIKNETTKKTYTSGIGMLSRKLIWDQIALAVGGLNFVGCILLGGQSLFIDIISGILLGFVTFGITTLILSIPAKIQVGIEKKRVKNELVKLLM